MTARVPPVPTSMPRTGMSHLDGSQSSVNVHGATFKTKPVTLSTPRPPGDFRKEFASALTAMVVEHRMPLADNWRSAMTEICKGNHTKIAETMDRRKFLGGSAALIAGSAALPG